MFSKRAPELRPYQPGSDGPQVGGPEERSATTMEAVDYPGTAIPGGGGTRRGLLAVPLAVMTAALLAVTLLAAPGDGAGPVEQIAGASGAPAAPAAQAACTEAALRDTLAESDAVDADLVYEVTHLACADGYGWAVISANHEGADVFLTISDAGLTLIDLGTGICPSEDGIPADVAARIAPPGRNIGCGAEAPEPIETDAHFTG